MGSYFSAEETKNFLSTLEQVDSLIQPNFGQIDVYRCNEPPYEYVMDRCRNFGQEADRLRKQEQMLMKPLEGIVADSEPRMCIKSFTLHCYCSYFNFTLKEAIAKKKSCGGLFPESELIYVFSSLVDLSLTLQHAGLLIGQLRPDCIYLSPEGYVKIYLLDIEEDNRHSSFYTGLAQPTSIPDLILSPQQLHCILNHSTNYDPYKAQLFAIAMVLLQLITLDRTRFYYNEKHTELRISKIQFNLSTVGAIYSQLFLNLLKHCLQPDPINRPSLAETNDALSQLRSVAKSTSYCLRIAEEEGQMRRQMPNLSTLSSKGLHILHGLQKKLTPSPISTFSVSTNYSRLKEQKNQ